MATTTHPYAQSLLLSQIGTILPRFGRSRAELPDRPEGEAEYRLVLQQVPDDTDILTALADVLLWQKKYQDALQVLDHARKIAPTDPEILLRRARILSLLGRAPEARTEYQEVLKFDPNNKEAKAGLSDLRPKAKHELRVGDEADFFNYADTAQTQGVNLNSRWNPRWSTAFGANIYQRFGENAGSFTASADFHPTEQDWVGLGGALANTQQVVPIHEAFFEFGHVFRLHNYWIRGVESSYQQHWFWYSGAHVLMLTSGQTVYLPKDWTWSLTLTGARTGFGGEMAYWKPSGWTKLGFPFPYRLSGNLFYAVGTEYFSEIDQIGRSAGRTYGGGLRYQLAERQDVTGFVSREDRNFGQIQTSFGLSYGIHF